MKILHGFASLALFVLVGCQSTTLTSAKLYIKQGEQDEARQQLEQALINEPNNAEIHYLLGKIAAEEGRFTEMATSFALAGKLGAEFGADIDAIRRGVWIGEYNRGVKFATSANPDFAAARTAFINAAIISPNEVRSWGNLAYAYYQLDSLDAAIASYQHVTEIAPNDTSTYVRLGSLFMQQRRYGSAVLVLERALALDSTDADVFVNLGASYEHQDRFEEAESAYHQAIAADPEAASAFYNLGNLYWRSQDFAAAVGVFEHVLELEPKNDDALYSLALSHISLGDEETALALLRDLSVRVPENASVWRELGRIYAMKNMAEESARAYEREEVLAP